LAGDTWGRDYIDRFVHARRVHCRVRIVAILTSAAESRLHNIDGTLLQIDPAFATIYAIYGH